MYLLSSLLSFCVVAINVEFFLTHVGLLSLSISLIFTIGKEALQSVGLSLRALLKAFPFSLSYHSLSFFSSFFLIGFALQAHPLVLKFRFSFLWYLLCFQLTHTLSLFSFISSQLRVTGSYERTCYLHRNTQLADDHTYSNKQAKIGVHGHRCFRFSSSSLSD